MYSYQTRSQATGLITDKHRAKGIQATASSSLRHADFLEQLRDPKENRLPNRRIGNHFHHLYTIQVAVRRFLDILNCVYKGNFTNLVIFSTSESNQTYSFHLDPEAGIVWLRRQALPSS